MKRVQVLFLILVFSVAFISGCEKSESDFERQMAMEEQLRKDFEMQVAKDDQLIKDFIAANNITNAQSDKGVYYRIIEPGTGNVVYQANTVINVKYTGRLLNGEIFDSSPSVEFPLGQLIPGWIIGIQKIQRGGKIRLLIPSNYGYGTRAQSKIPANSVLDFDIELL